MIEINNWESMRHLGFNVLTGEACAYGMRLLADVDAEGRKIALAYFGMLPDTKLADPYNGTVPSPRPTKSTPTPTVGSLMLTRSCLGDLAVFGLRYVGTRCVLRVEREGHFHSAMGFAGGEDAALAVQWAANYGGRGYAVTPYFHEPSKPGVGSGFCRDRNVHEMTGRSM